MDPSLGAVLAARRVAASLGLAARFVVGDARFLPFHGRSFDRVFSYSVLQHLSRDHVRLAVDDMARVTAPAGSVLVQMPTRFGIRCLYHQARRRFREAAEFEVRYWTIPQLRRLFGRIGPAAVSVDCFFGIGLQRSDAALMPARLKVVLAASEALRAASGVLRPLVYLADSVYVTAQRAG
jgi:SAM-dependent methyltransferase